jgi:hypothetical protein
METIMSGHDEQERQERESEERQMDTERLAALRTRQELTDSEAEARIQQREEEEEYGRYQELTAIELSDEGYSDLDD